MNQNETSSQSYRDTAITILSLLGFAVLSVIFIYSRPETPGQEEQETERRSEIRQEVEQADQAKLNEEVGQRVSIDTGIAAVAEYVTAGQADQQKSATPVPGTQAAQDAARAAAGAQSDSASATGAD